MKRREFVRRITGALAGAMMALQLTEFGGPAEAPEFDVPDDAFDQIYDGMSTYGRMAPNGLEFSTDGGKSWTDFPDGSLDSTVDVRIARPSRRHVVPAPTALDYAISNSSRGALAPEQVSELRKIDDTSERLRYILSVTGKS